MDQKTSTHGRVGDALPASRTLNLDNARTFVAVCETGSFRQAAVRVNRSPSAVSLQIAKLEELLDCTLLHRDARGVALTEQGELLLGYARRLLGISDEAMALFQGAAISGVLRLAAPHDLGVSLVPSLLRRFAETHPRVRVDVRLESSTAIQHLFAEGAFNVALFSEGKTPLVTATELFSEDLCWLSLGGGRAARQEPLPLAVAEVGCSWRDAALRALDVAHRAYRIAYSSDTSMGQIAAVRADLAVAALPRSLIDRDIVRVPEECGLPQLGQVHMHLAEDGSDTAKAFAALVTSWNRLSH